MQWVITRLWYSREGESGGYGTMSSGIFFVADVCGALTDAPNDLTARKYWNKLAQILGNEGSEVGSFFKFFNEKQSDFFDLTPGGQFLYEFLSYDFYRILTFTEGELIPCQ
ncbi:hypothetical protein JW926_17995 [Candidatus Sumerlaeota bacterium]|nr:hypothetical protein [Candidatus Sumerlaeota bacterium]